ncbi:MAG: amino acid permease [Bacillota bacterium]
MERKLEKSLNPVLVLFMALGLTVGIWVNVEHWWIGVTGPSIALAFVVCAILLIPIALVYAELTPAIPYAGGEVYYTGAAFGPGIAFWVGWTQLLPYLAMPAFIVMATVEVTSFLLGAQTRSLKNA